MITEYLAYPQGDTVEMVVEDLRGNSDQYSEFEVRYLYAMDAAGRLTGVVPMRRMVMSRPGMVLADLRIDSPATVTVGRVGG